MNGDSCGPRVNRLGERFRRKRNIRADRASRPSAMSIAPISPSRARHRHPDRHGVLHKIGVTGSKIGTRIANARLDPTFLMADVEVVATYELYNINRVKLENIIHRVFDPVQLDLEIKDRFGNPVRPREWFLVPLFIVDEVVDRIKDGSITQYIYDPQKASLVSLV
jgi:hypothetical protein